LIEETTATTLVPAGMVATALPYGLLLDGRRRQA
jgi:hypothetical protein